MGNTEKNKLGLKIATQLNSKIIKVIKSHNTPSTILICKRDSQKLAVKYEFGEIDNSVKKEILWYSKVGKNLEFIPKYLGKIETRNFATLILSFIENALTIDDLSLNKRNYDLVNQSVNKSLLYLQTLFEIKPKKTVSLDKANELFLRKFEKRLEIAKKYKYLRDLFDRKGVVINGENYPNYRYYIEKITDGRLFKYLTPRVHGVIHGDLHCGNILVQKNKKIFFVDPNGNFSMPIEYDYGKIFHSVHGGYGSIMKGKYQLRESKEDRFEFSVLMPEVYKSVFNEFTKKLPKDLFIRSLYAEAMHFATMLPHHAKRRKETKALFLRSILLFKELFDLLS